MSMGISLSREVDNFSIMAPAGSKYRIKILNLALHVKKIALQPSYVAQVNRMLDNGQRARYPLVRSIVKTRTVPKASQYVPLNDVFTGRLPNTFIFGMIDTKAYQGSLTANPFNFKNMGVSSVSLMVNSKSHPAIRYQPNFKQNLFMREYRGLNDAIGVKFHNQGCMITPELFKNGNTLFAFDMSPDQCQNFHIHATDRGTMSLELYFSEPTTEDMTVVMYATMSDEVR